VVIDTSSSMSRPLLNAAVTEINALLQRLGVSELLVVVCDAAATPPQRVRRIGELALSGGGGTDLRVGIAAAAECRPSPQIIVVLTDGFTPWPQEAPPRTKLIAIIIGNHAPLPEGTGITSLRIKEPQ
jgi:predicted metal-dependent peptidase